MARNIPSLKRRSAYREPARRIIIFTEGAVTEPTYMRGLAQRQGSALVSIQPQHGVPRSLIQSAKTFIRHESRRFDSASKKDRIWLVFDCDDHPEISNVIKEAGEANISVAFSNPCFEVWLLLHFSDHDAPDHRHDVQRRLCGECASYSQQKKSLKFADLADGLAAAISRAEAMRRRRDEENNARGRPYTDVDLLVRQILL